MNIIKYFNSFLNVFSSILLFFFFPFLLFFFFSFFPFFLSSFLLSIVSSYLPSICMFSAMNVNWTIFLLLYYNLTLISLLNNPPHSFLMNDRANLMWRRNCVSDVWAMIIAALRYSLRSLFNYFLYTSYLTLF